MILDTDTQGPGEQTGSNQLPLESCAQRVPEGETWIVLPPPVLPVSPISGVDRRLIARSDGRDRIRSTSTDQDALPVIRLVDSTSEVRVDASLDDLQRETALDPVHDDLGPHTDRG